MPAGTHATPASARVRLARIAHHVAVGTRGVAHPMPGRRLATPDGQELVPGVVVAAVPGERYSITLHLAVHPVALETLAERIRAAVLLEASAAGLAAAVGPIDVSFEDVVEPGTETAS